MVFSIASLFQSILYIIISVAFLLQSPNVSFSCSKFCNKRERYKDILSPCLFNFYAEYIMRNAGLEEAQAGIKIAGRNINWRVPESAIRYFFSVFQLASLWSFPVWASPALTVLCSPPAYPSPQALHCLSHSLLGPVDIHSCQVTWYYVPIGKPFFSGKELSSIVIFCVLWIPTYKVSLRLRLQLSKSLDFLPILYSLV